MSLKRGLVFSEFNLNVANPASQKIYEFGEFRLDGDHRMLYSGEKDIPLVPKAVEILLALIERPGKIVAKYELLEIVWPDVIVEESNLFAYLSVLRKTLGTRENGEPWIETLRRRGYRFTGEVRIAKREDLTQRGSTRSSIQINANDRIVPIVAGNEYNLNGSARPVHSTINVSPEDLRDARTSRRWFTILATAVVSSLLLLGLLFQRETSTGSVGSITSIAILPFKPISEQDRNQSFELGMTNELIAKLAEAEGLTVRSFQAVKGFTSGDAIDAGKDLEVDAVLDCSVQVSADRVRVFVKLIRVADSKQLWTDSFNRDRTELLEMQEAIAERVASALRVQLSENAKKRYTDNAPAYKLYLEGQGHLTRLGAEEAKLAIAKFQEAVELDPNYALAHAGIARGYMSLVLSAEAPPAEMIERSLAAAEKAAQIDPKLAEAHATLGALYFWFKHDWEASEAAFKTALELDPHSAYAHVYYGALLGNLGRIEEALAQVKKARDIDPFWAFSTSMQGTILVHAGRPEEALTRYGEALRLNPRLWTAHSKAALALIELNRYDDALTTARKATEINSSQTNSLALEGYALAKLDRRREAEKILNDLLERSRQGYVPEYHIAVVYAGLGNRESALTWLERGFHQKDPRMIWLRSENFWDDLRSEPRFIELMKKMRFEQ